MRTVGPLDGLAAPRSADGAGTPVIFAAVRAALGDADGDPAPDVALFPP